MPFMKHSRVILHVEATVVFPHAVFCSVNCASIALSRNKGLQLQNNYVCFLAIGPQILAVKLRRVRQRQYAPGSCDKFKVCAIGEGYHTRRRRTSPAMALLSIAAILHRSSAYFRNLTLTPSNFRTY